VAQIESFPAPAGVDPVFFHKLKGELIRTLRTQDHERSASQVALTEENRVTDVAQNRHGGQLDLTWTERAIGDYNFDGQVSAADLVPLAVSWLKDSSDPSWNTIKCADGDGNGVIGLGDVPPIGRNYGNQLMGYDVLTGATTVFGDCNWAGFAGHGTATLVGSVRHYSITFNEADVSLCFYVAPDDGTNVGIESLPSYVWGSPNWAHTAHFNQFDGTKSIAYDASREVYYIAGSTDSNTTGSHDFALAKYDDDGTLLWARAWGTSGIEYSYGVAVAPDGSVYQAGESDTIGVGGGDAVLVKWSAAGSVLWARGWGSTGTNGAGASGVAADSGGNAFVAATIGDGTTSSMVLLKYDPAGTVQNATTWGTGAMDRSVAVCTDASGVYVAGYTDRGMVGSIWDPVVLRYDFNAVRQWGKFLYTTPDCEATCIALDSNNVYVGANTGPYAIGYPTDAVAVCLDKTGSVQWATFAGGTDLEWAAGIAADGAGNVYLAGLCQSLTPGMSAAMLQKYDASGNMKWNVLWHQTHDVELTGLVINEAGMLVASGYTNTLNHQWDMVGMPSGTLVFSPADIVGADLPLTGTETDATSLATPEELYGEIDTDTDPLDINFLIVSYNPH
jgi:hypothetical protein